MEIKTDETYHVASCCCPQYVHEVFGENSLLHLSFIVQWQGTQEADGKVGLRSIQTSTIFFLFGKIESSR